MRSLNHLQKLGTECLATHPPRQCRKCVPGRSITAATAKAELGSDPNSGQPSAPEANTADPDLGSDPNSADSRRGGCWAFCYWCSRAGRPRLATQTNTDTAPRIRGMGVRAPFGDAAWALIDCIDPNGDLTPIPLRPPVRAHSAETFAVWKVIKKCSCPRLSSMR